MAESAYLGHKIRRLRRERRLTQLEMADRLGISASYLNLIENGQRRISVPVLLKLAQVFDVELQQFAEDDQARLAGELAEVFGDPLFRERPLPEADLREVAGRMPELAEGVLHLYRAYRAAREQAQGLAERLSGEGGAEGLEGVRPPSEEVSDFIQGRGNHFAELEAAAETLWEEAGLDPRDLYHGLVDHLAETYAVDVAVVAVGPEAEPVRRYDPASRRLALSELLPPRSRTFQLAHQVGLLSQGRVFDRLIAGAKLMTPEAEALARVALANYFAGAVMMPYARILEAARELRYDIELLENRFGASFEQVCHRLTTLNRPGAKGVPFHFVRVDIAGNISKRFSASGMRFARYGGGCALWAAHAAFLTPGKIHVQLSRMPDGATFFSIARTITKAGGGERVAQSHFAIELGCEVAHAKELVYADAVSLERPETAVPIGVSCRICERLHCRQRAFPPLHHELAVDVNTRGLSAYVSAAPSR